MCSKWPFEVMIFIKYLRDQTDFGIEFSITKKGDRKEVMIEIFISK